MTGHMAVLSGTWNKPEIRCYFNEDEPHPQAPDKTLKMWLEDYIVGSCKGFARFDWKQRCWVVSATGPDPERKFELAGFEIDYSETPGTTLSHVISLDELVTPITKLASDGRRALVLPRLLGFERTKLALGGGGVWNREFRRFEISAVDSIYRGQPRPDIQWDPAILAAAQEMLGRETTPEHLIDAVAAAGAAKDILEMNADDVAKLIEAVGDVPDWFGLDLFPFQRIGSIGVAAGHNALFDEPGLGKTRQSIAAAAIVGAKRTLITCLPVGLTGWKREVEESLLHTLGGQYPDGKVVVIRSGVKEPPLPETGVVITTDGLVSHRERSDLLDRLCAWAPDVLIYDEAHRGKSPTSARSIALTKLSFATRRLPVPVTGTPLLANPAELIPLLTISGHLNPVFGGEAAFLAKYCRPDGFGGWRAFKPMLPDLSAKLSQHVWVRRRKRDVLPDLPKTQRVAKWVDVPLTEYRKAHREVIAILTEWLKGYKKKHGEWPDDEAIHEYAASQVGLVSLLRRAAGLAKIDAVVEDIRTHVNDTTIEEGGRKVYTRPLIVWAHHREVSDALSEAVPAAVGGTGIIRGGVSHAERDRVVREFQEGKIPVIVCSIAAAGVAITLTASSDMFFAESDWTVAMIRQAMDRAERIGQTADKLTATTYLADGTLDGRIQQVLKEKSKILDAVYGDGNDVSVIDDKTDAESSTEIVISLIEDALEKLRK